MLHSIYPSSNTSLANSLYFVVEHDPKAPISEGTLHTDPNGNTRTAGERAEEAKYKAQEAKEQARSAKEQAKDGAREAKATHDSTGPGGLRERAKQTAQANDDPVRAASSVLTAL